MQYFGPDLAIRVGTWKSAVDIPVGLSCLFCKEMIGLSDSGIMMPHIISQTETKVEPWHLECHQRAIFGSVAHQKDECNCSSQHTTEPPDEMTKRQAARAAVQFYEKKNGPLKSIVELAMDEAS